MQTSFTDKQLENKDNKLITETALHKDIVIRLKINLSIAIYKIFFLIYDFFDLNLK